MSGPRVDPSVDGAAGAGAVLERSRGVVVAVAAGPTLGPAIGALLADVYAMRVVADPSRAAVALNLAPHPMPRGAPLVLLSAERPDGARLVDLVRSGCLAVLPDDAPVESVVEALVAVAEGSSGLGAVDVRALCDALRAESPRPSGVPSLTPREEQLLAATFAGMSIKQTARVLGISHRTVENLQRPLFRKLGVKTRAEAIVRAHELGLHHRVAGTPPPP